MRDTTLKVPMATADAGCRVLWLSSLHGTVWMTTALTKRLEDPDWLLGTKQLPWQTDFLVIAVEWTKEHSLQKWGHWWANSVAVSQCGGICVWSKGRIKVCDNHHGSRSFRRHLHYVSAQHKSRSPGKMTAKEGCCIINFEWIICNNDLMLSEFAVLHFEAWLRSLPFWKNSWNHGSAVECEALHEVP